MRLCRFVANETLQAGFYLDDRVVPIGRAVDEYASRNRLAVTSATTDDLLEYLPPAGPSSELASNLSEWLEALEPASLDPLCLPMDRVKLLVPTPRPPKILLLAGNYAAHVVERGEVAPERSETFPYVFMKPPTTTLTHPGDPIVIPHCSPDHVDWEAELGVVIGRRGRDIAEADALQYVAGYTVVNDVSDRKYTPNPDRKPRERDKFFDWLHGKWHDTFCPVGPCVASTSAIPDPQDLRITLTVNGETRQDGLTSQMVFPVAAVIAFVSRWITLEPGDLISTGTPSGVGSASGTYLKAGDVVVASIGGIGSLGNPVAASA